MRSCQICGKKDLEIIIDGATRLGPWAYMCESCHKLDGCGFGIGLGQLLKYDHERKKYKIVKGGNQDEVQAAREIITRASKSDGKTAP